jgi:hypothetical protein
MKSLLQGAEATLLASERWQFSVTVSPDALRDAIRRRVSPASRWAFILPFEYSGASDFRGYVDGDRIWVKVIPSKLSLRSLFSSSAIFQFAGTLREGTAGARLLCGSYRLTPYFRYFMLLWCALVCGLGLTFAGLAPYFAVRNQDWERSLIGLLGLVVCLAMLGAVHLVARFYRFINGPYRDHLHRFLQDSALGVQEG